MGSSDFSIPEHFSIQYSAEQIAEASCTLGSSIADWGTEVWNSTGKDILAIPILRGGIFFFADLVREIHCSVEVAPARTRAYTITGNEEADEIELDLREVPAEGRSILLVDDICDSGRTLQTLTKAFQEIGATEVRSAVLIKRMLEQKTFDPEWVGFQFDGDEWFVGYGMEDSNRWSNLPDIYTIQQG